MIIFLLLYRYECKIVQCIQTVDNVWVLKILTAAGVPWRISARFGATVEMQLRIRCIGSHTNQDVAPQSLQCSPMSCKEPLPGKEIMLQFFPKTMHCNYSFFKILTHSFIILNTFSF